MRYGARLAWLAGLTIVMLAGAVVIGVHATNSGRAGRDPRAYVVDSGDVSLDEGLRRAGIGLPECLRKDLRYALIDDGFGYYRKIYLRLQSSVDCMDSFLLANAMHDTFQATRIGGVTAERPLTYRELWMDRYPVPQLKWQIGPEQRFQEFAAGGHHMYQVRVLVQQVPESSTVRAYVYAFHGG